MSDPNIIYSGLGDHITVDGQEFKVEIYRLENNPDWILEVIDQDGTSTVWDDPFPSDKAAFDELQTVTLFRSQKVKYFLKLPLINTTPYPIVIKMQGCIWASISLKMI